MLLIESLAFVSTSLSWITASLTSQNVLTPGQEKPVLNSAVLPSYYTFNWTAVHATSSLRWRPCYDGFECTRLELPIDWSNSSNPNKVQLALIRLPASVPETDPSFGGTILYNPGGPGLSGVEILRWNGYGMRDVVDGEKKFSILSWDTRGVFHSTPQMSCWKDGTQRSIWGYRGQVIGPSDRSKDNLFEKWTICDGFGRLCKEERPGSLPDGSSIASFMTTALSARDMVEIIDLLEDDRSKLLRSSSVGRGRMIDKDKRPALLNFWGDSYGTHLGNTFASIYPSRIGRLMLDSVVGSEDFVSTDWYASLFDLKKNLAFFFEDCFAAGDACAINRLGFESVKEMATAVEILLEQLRYRPIIAVEGGIPQLTTFNDLSSLFLEQGAYPNWSWVQLAEIVADLLEADGTSMAQYLPSISISTSTTVDQVGQDLLDGKNKTRAWPPGWSATGEADAAIKCGDGDDITNSTLEDFEVRIQKMVDLSPLAGWRWVEKNPMLCAHWPKSLRPSENNRFRGPFRSNLSQYDSRASPIFFLGNTGDPYTPIRNAFHAASLHEGSSVLVQDGPGHCTGYVNPSACTHQYIKRFFATGALPKNGTMCVRDRTAWQ